jgi:uncharacterized membrane protein
LLSYRGGETAGAGQSPEDASADMDFNGRYLPSPTAGDGRLWVRTMGMIQRDPQELYAIWRDVEAAPLWQQHVSEVRLTGETTSHWQMRSGNKTVEWKSEILADEPGKRIAWQSIAGDFNHAGEVVFEAAPAGDGTLVTVLHQFDLSKIASAWETITGCNPKQAVSENLRHFKALAETGQAVRKQAQPQRSKGLVSKMKELSLGEQVDMPPVME